MKGIETGLPELSACAAVRTGFVMGDIMVAVGPGSTLCLRSNRFAA